MKKVKTGIYGLNRLMDGGINQNSTTVVIGASGAGKTTLAIQFIRKGLESGKEGIFVSLDENKEQIIREAVEMGWKEIHDYLENETLVFIDASGVDFSTFIRKELPNFVSDWKNADARVTIDPLTPVIWAEENKYVQRELISLLLKQMRRVGTVLCTLEEHGRSGELTGQETVIPMYLADSIIHLRYSSMGGPVTRELQILKCRSSKHSERRHPYRIMKGLGLVVQTEEEEEVQDGSVMTRLQDEFEKQSTQVNPAMKKKLSQTLQELNSEDLRHLDLSTFVRCIIEEHQ